METVNNLLSHKYVEFASRIISLAFIRRNAQDHLRTPLAREEYNRWAISLYWTENEAMKAQREYEDWKKECLTNIGDG